MVRQGKQVVVVVCGHSPTEAGLFAGLEIVPVDSLSGQEDQQQGQDSPQPHTSPVFDHSEKFGKRISGSIFWLWVRGGGLIFSYLGT